MKKVRPPKKTQRTAPKRKTLLEALRACPADLNELVVARSRELARAVTLTDSRQV